MDDYVAKPVTPEALDAALRRWVSAAAAPAARAAAAGRRGRRAPRRGDGRDADVARRRRHADGRAGRDLPRHRPGPPRRDPRRGHEGQRRRSSSARPTASSAAARTSAAGGWPTCARSSRCSAARARSRARPSCSRRSRRSTRRSPAARGPAGATPEARRRLRGELVIRDALRTLVEALFRVLFSYDCVGEEKIPAAGPAIVAANHPSYLDPILLSLPVKRPDPLHGLGRDPPRAAARRLGPALRRLPGGRHSRAGPLRLRHREAARRGGRAGRHLPGGQALAGGLDGARAARGRRAARARDGRAARAGHDPRRLPGLAPLPARCRAGRIQVRYHEPIDPAPFRSLARGRGDRGAARRAAAPRGAHAHARRQGRPRIEACIAASAPWPRSSRPGPRSASRSSSSGRRGPSRRSGPATPTSATCCWTCS